jgi:hypothetical protein
MSKFNPNDDKYLDYFVVVESDNGDNKEFRILADGSNYLRYYCCLQTMNTRNRNKRMWLTEHVKVMAAAEHITELMTNGSWSGENGHPVPPTGKITMERILTIDPNNMSHRVTELRWESDSRLCGVCETLDEGPGSPGYRFMKNIQQGMVPSKSLRSLVPQRNNADGTIDVLGPGRMICYDRVILPSHKEAYRDTSVPIKNIITKSNFDVAMEGFTDFILERSGKVNKIIDKMDPVVESAITDNNGIISVNTAREGRVFISPEIKYRKEIKDLMKNF